MRRILLDQGLTKQVSIGQPTLRYWSSAARAVERASPWITTFTLILPSHKRVVPQSSSFG